MSTNEIPRSEWATRLDKFSKDNEGRNVSLEVAGPNLGVQREIDRLPLIGVSSDRAKPDGTIAIAAARSASDQVTHVVHDVTHIYLQADAGNESLEVESRDGVKALLRFEK